ncbi:MAG TPA: 50S ribosomal protein L2 [Spirochaetota bacterium]|jgi:large subunit ribosomal protein L2|nr:50S ribosomal protein L2 [Spirochaetota bacterium]OQB00367.1 MAG: 50S ribosomal protein L2 [Spirochaetes bacterium ADurb.Bin218]HON16713.1 50S ribosomal protein L2 [Spirochaetota bacterium]HOQ10737.1 50S ribosomal protein L2 [Spirochaetota bacterium]HPD78573.1 50S ribosomal protein L2 [Spirochaetota bacterium]
MGIKKFRPITPTLRYKTVLDKEEITEEKPYKPLTKGKTGDSGRGFKGQVTVRRRGGGHKRKLRLIDFKRNKYGIPGKVVSIEYDPNRTAYIALISYADGEKRYIIAPEGLKVGDKVESGENAEIKPGNNLPLKKIPLGANIYNIELHRGKGGQLVRSAGTTAILAAREEDYCLIKLPSGEIRKVHSECYSTIGSVGNKDHINVTIGKAGRSRWLNKRPKVRGVAMNPVDHPLGGGEGKSSGGRHPVSPTGMPTKGYKTRKKKKYSDKYIIKRRKG